MTIAVGSSSRSINALLPVTLKVTSPTSSSKIEGGLEATVYSSALVVGYCSEASASVLSVPIASSVKGPGGRDEAYDWGNLASLP